MEQNSPTLLNFSNNIKDITMIKCGNKYSYCLLKSGNIYKWGK